MFHFQEKKDLFFFTFKEKKTNFFHFQGGHFFHSTHMLMHETLKIGPIVPNSVTAPKPAKIPLALKQIPSHNQPSLQHP